MKTITLFLKRTVWPCLTQPDLTDEDGEKWALPAFLIWAVFCIIWGYILTRAEYFPLFYLGSPLIAIGASVICTATIQGIRTVIMVFWEFHDAEKDTHELCGGD